MHKKQILTVILIVGITFQLSFAESVKFKSRLEGIKLDGIITKPEGEGPFPAVVLLHDCFGLDETNSRDNAWVDRLVKWGYATFQVDSFRPRGISIICNKIWSIAAMIGKRAQDAYEAKSYLAKLSFVDPNRLAVMGWSHGGASVLEAITKSIADDNPFTAAVSFYPGCYKHQANSPLNQAKSPILIMIGEKDDWSPVDDCINFMPTEKTNHEAILKIYPEAYHDFDDEGMDKVYESHRLLYNPLATKDSIGQVKKFLSKYLK